MRLDQLIAQADEVIEKRAAKAPEATPAPASNDDDTVKLASFLRDLEPGSAEPLESSPFQMTFIEKLAYSVAMVEAVTNFEELHKLAEFEEKALAAGHTQEQVDAFLEKRSGLVGDTVGATKRFASKHPGATGLGVLAATHAAAGAAGHSKGKQSGYEKGQADFMRALQEQSAPAHE